MADSSDETTIVEIKDDHGNVLKTISLKNGVPHGEMKIFDEKVELSAKLVYDNGVLTGPAEFFLAGKPTMIAVFKDGKLEGDATLFSNGIKVGIAHFKDDLFNGEFTSYDEFGNIIRIAIYAGGQQNGECQAFYPDGTLMEHSNYLNNQLDGERIRYYPSGNVMETSTFTQGKPCGVVDMYDDDGDLKSRKEVDS